ncbi:hypothetical protein GmHk_13G037911 [Glycine max]|nr:hypothetical protein GmHk_13G037911 [Glycine max]
MIPKLELEHPNSQFLMINQYFQWCFGSGPEGLRRLVLYLTISFPLSLSPETTMAIPSALNVKSDLVVLLSKDEGRERCSEITIIDNKTKIVHNQNFDIAIEELLELQNI